MSEGGVGDRDGMGLSTELSSDRLVESSSWKSMVAKGKPRQSGMRERASALEDGGTIHNHIRHIYKEGQRLHASAGR